jgi:ATP-dependent Lon protease
LHPDQRRRRRSGNRRHLRIGTVARVLQLLKLPDGTVKVLVEGIGRAEIDGYTAARTSTRRWHDALEEPEEDPVEIEALSRSVVSEFENYVKLNKKISPEVVGAASSDRRLLEARRYRRFAPVHQDRREAGNAGDDERQAAA